MQQSTFAQRYSVVREREHGTEDRVTECRIVLSHIVDEPSLMNLHKWLYNTAKGRSKRISRSATGDIVHHVVFGRSIPLQRMLSALPFVAHVMKVNPETLRGRPRFGSFARPIDEYRITLKNDLSAGLNLATQYLAS